MPMIELTHMPIDPEAVLAAVRDFRAGAHVLFLGTVREITGGRETESLDYEAHGEMAVAQLEKLAAEAEQRWPVLRCAIVHRLGHLELGDVSVAVAVSTPHRGDAFDAGQWIMDTLKERVPIWKCENWADGQREWVHPGAPTNATAPVIADATRSDQSGNERKDPT